MDGLQRYNVTQGHMISERNKQQVLSHTCNLENNICISVNKYTLGPV